MITPPSAARTTLKQSLRNTQTKGEHGISLDLQYKPSSALYVLCPVDYSSQVNHQPLCQCRVMVQPAERLQQKPSETGHRDDYTVSCLLLIYYDSINSLQDHVIRCWGCCCARHLIRFSLSVKTL